MKNQDKIELLLDIQEHPEKYSDEQLNSMLAEEMVWFDGQQPITYSVPKEVEPRIRLTSDWRTS